MLRVTGYPVLREGLEYLKKYVAEAEETGRRVVIFCEDRLTLLAEQSVCRALGGSFLTSVTTFARFLRYEGKTLSKQGSVMVVGKILADNADKLKCLSFRGGIKNGAATVYEMLSQLYASKITGDMLLKNLPEDGLLQDKLRDLSLVYAKYEEFLTQNGYADESRYLSMLPSAVRSDKNIRGANVVFLGFSSFTAQAIEGVRAACETAENVLGLFPAGNNEIYTNQAASSFKKACEEYGEVKVLQIKIPPEKRTAADILRENLYAPEIFSATYTPVKSFGAVRVRQVRDEEEELRFVCARIKKHVLEGGRYAEAAVFVPDVKKYSLLLSKTFGEYGIPYFADLKKPLSAHPFAYFLLALLRASADGCTPVAAEQIASSVYFGDGGAYRNYLAKFCNYRGGAKREIKEGDVIKGYDRDYLIGMRDRLLLGMGAFSRKSTGRKYCSAVRKIYEDFNVKAITDHIAETCGDELQKGYLTRMDAALDSVLKEAEELLGDAQMSVGEFSSLIEAGFAACEASLLPLGIDQVFVGDVSQSRTPENKLVFALGMTDEVPLCGEDTALISDKEMQRLETVKIKIEPSVAQVNARTRENVCLNICSFGEALYLLYSSQADEERSESDILRYARRIFSDTSRPENLFVYECSEPMPALKELLRYKGAYCEGRADTRREYASLYAALMKKESVAEAAKSLFEGKRPVFFVENGEKLFFSGGEVSPTLLENYYTCPYRSFTTMGLKLKEREETAVMFTDAGIFVHAVLEAVAENVKNLNDEAECFSFACQAAEKLFEKPVFSPLKDTKAGEYSARRLIEESALVAREMYKQIKNSEFQVKYTEYTCRLPEEHMRGKIDRVDESEKYVRVIDYKTGNIDDSALSYYVGKKLQLQLYMSAISNEKIPAGVYYFPASVSYSKEGDAPFRMLGFMNGDEEVLRASDVNLQEGQKSAYFNAAPGKNKTDKVMDEEDFRAFIAYSVLVGRQGSTELKQGFIAPTPYGNSCRYCAYKGMCAALGEAVERKTEEKITCKSIADIVKRIKQGEE